MYFLKSNLPSNYLFSTSKIWQEIISTPKTSVPQTKQLFQIQPGSQTHHFLCNTNRLQCQTFTAQRGRTPLPMWEGAEFQLCFEHWVLAPVTIREQQGWAALEQGEACLHHGQGNVLPKQGAVLQHLFYSSNATVHVIPTISFTPPLHAQ